MPHLFSIVVKIGPDSRGRTVADWTLPEEVDDLLRAYWGMPDMSLEQIFRLRLADGAFPFFRWDWALVVLPGRYRIGGHLANARGGSPSNMPLIDAEVVRPHTLDRRIPGDGDPYPMPLPRRSSSDVHVSAMWIPTKGMLEAMADRAGGWLAQLAQNLKHVPENKSWVYFADTPPDDWVTRVSERNSEQYEAWSRLERGPDWCDAARSDDAMICRMEREAALYARGEHQARLLRSYLRRRPTDALAWAALGWNMSNAERHRRAMAAAIRAARLAPEWVYPRHLAMRSLFLLLRNAEAGEIAESILAQYPLDALAHIVAAYGARHGGRKDEALRFISRAAQLNPTDRNLNLLGNWLHEKGFHDQAAEVFKRKLLRDPDDALTMNNYGYMLALCGEFDKALILCEEACRLERSADNLDSLGYIYMRTGKVNEAIAIFREVLGIKPDHAEALRHLDEAEAMAWSHDPGEVKQHDPGK